MTWLHLASLVQSACVSPSVPSWADALEALQQEYAGLAEKQCEEEAELVAESQHCLGLVDMQR